MDIVDRLRTAGKPDGRTYEVMSKAAREIERLRGRVDELDVEVGSLRWVEERLEKATRLLRELSVAVSKYWMPYGLMEKTRAFLNEAESAERGVVVPTPWVGAEPPQLLQYRAALGAIALKTRCLNDGNPPCDDPMCVCCIARWALWPDDGIPDWDSRKVSGPASEPLRLEAEVSKDGEDEPPDTYEPRVWGDE